MAKFEVWAPKPQKVELYLKETLDGRAETRTLPMQIQDVEGVWAVEMENARPGLKYGYLLDGEGPYPDPCSAWQPDGVHSLSRYVNHALFAWSDNNFQAGPLASAVIYELHIGTFTPEGTFDAAILKLDYLKELGITHLELLPVSEFPGRWGWGYDGVDIFAPENAYGGPEGLKRLVDACHARGLAVILDVVYNHVGPSGNYLDKFGPFHSDLHNTAWGQAMNFDGPGSDGVRQFFIENARMWLRDYHLDGLRLDAVHAIVDNSAMHFLEELSESIRELEIEVGRHLVLIAESDLNDPRVVTRCELGGYGIDAQWSDDFHHALHVLLTGEQSGYYADYTPWDDLCKVMDDVFVYNGEYSPSRQRRHGRRVGTLPGYKFLGYIQNHDQVGNRAQGERISHLVGVEKAKIAAALVLTAPFVPMLFMGEEWAASTPFQYFSDHEEENLAKAVSEGRRNEFSAFGWKPEEVPDPQQEETYLRSKLNWMEQFEEPHASMLAWYRQLIALRRKLPILMNGDIEHCTVTDDPDGGWLILHRGPIRIACNLGEKNIRIPYKTAACSEPILVSDPRAQLGKNRLELPPYGVMIFEDKADNER